MPMTKTALCATIFGLVLVLCCAAFLFRSAWINKKIVALSSPPSLFFAEANAKLPPKGNKPRIVLIGDSRVTQWTTTQLTETYEVINRGISGEPLTQLALRFHPDAIALNPDIIVVESGSNDLVAASFMDTEAKSSTAQRTADTLLRLARQGAAPGRAVIIGTIIPPAEPDIWRLPVWSKSQRDLVAMINAKLRQTAFPDQTKLVDLASTVSSDGGVTLSKEYRRDTWHVNEKAYQKLDETLARYLQSAPELGEARRGQ